MSSTAKQFWGHQDDVCTDMFLAAQLWWGTEHAWVTIRNLSPSDALIDSAFIPTPNASVYLTRGCSRAEGRILWSKEGRLGVRFHSRVSVAEWLVPAGAEAELPRLDAQRTSLPFKRLALSEFPSEADYNDWKRGLSADLALVKRLVDKTGDSLATDPRMMQEHIVDLQSFDLTMQMLSTVCAELNGSQNGPTGMVGREEIRRSCLVALAQHFP